MKLPRKRQRLWVDRFYDAIKSDLLAGVHPSVAENWTYDGFPKPSLQWQKANGLYLEGTKREI